MFPCRGSAWRAWKRAMNDGWHSTIAEESQVRGKHTPVLSMLKAYELVNSINTYNSSHYHPWRNSRHSQTPLCTKRNTMPISPFNTSSPHYRKPFPPRAYSRDTRVSLMKCACRTRNYHRTISPWQHDGSLSHLGWKVITLERDTILELIVREW